MKKLLGILSSLTLVSATTVSVVSCGSIAKTIDQRIDLGKVIDDTDLGEFLDLPTDQQLLDRIRGLNEKLDVDDISIVREKNQKLLIEVKPGSKKYKQGFVELHYELSGLKNLDQDIKKINLGVFDFAPNESDILTKLKTLNPDIDTNQFIVMELTNNSAILLVKSGSKIYKPGETMTLTFNIDLRQKLTDVIKVVDLGMFNDLPNDKEILHKVKELNPEVNISEVKVVHETLTSFYISGKDDSKFYQPVPVKVTYSIKEKLDLQKIFQNRMLGSLTNPTNKEILNKIKELNHEVDLTEIKISNNPKNLGTVTVSVERGSKIYQSTSFDVFYIPLDKTKIVGIADYMNDHTYPDLNDYTNEVFNKGGDIWVNTKAITFGEFDFKEAYNYDNAQDFFKDYKINFDYIWGSNTFSISPVWNWAKNNGLPGSSSGKFLPLSMWDHKTVTFTSLNQVDKAFEDSNKYTKSDFTDTFENSKNPFSQAVAATHIWIEVSGNKILIKGQASAMYPASVKVGIGSAAFSRIQAQNIKIIKKN